MEMEYDKINNLLDSESENLSKFVTREYVRVSSLSNTYNEKKSIRFKTPMLRSDLCYYADAYILELMVQLQLLLEIKLETDKTDH